MGVVLKQVTAVVHMVGLQAPAVETNSNPSSSAQHVPIFLTLIYTKYCL